MAELNVAKEIMVIEDDATIRSALIEILGFEDYKTVSAQNGKEALDILKTRSELPSLILLDIMMPVMDGWQFREAQKKDSHIQGIPVVVITADGNAKEKALKMSAQGWVKKPIDIDALLETVQKCCL